MPGKLLQSKEKNSYSYNKSIHPYPVLLKEKIKPPENINDLSDNSEMFVIRKEEVEVDEQIRQHLDIYRKVERFIIVNFYTGGSPFRRGLLDAIYRGHNPGNM